MARPLHEPMAITETGLQLVLGVWSRGEMFREVVAEARAERERKQASGLIGPTNTSGSMSVAGSEAAIAIRGPLLAHANLMTDLSGATSYEQIARQVDAALADPAVTSIRLAIDSPGGQSAGCLALANKIRAANAIKPVTASIEGAGCSAAYLLAAAAGSVEIDPMAVAGSVGVLISLEDDTGAKEKEGVRRVRIVSSQSPKKSAIPITDEVIADFQQTADDMAAEFISAVAGFRKVSPEHVAAHFGAGHFLVGRKAVEAGLADRLITATRAAAGADKRTSMETPVTADLAAVTAQRDALIAAAGAADFDGALGAIRGGAQAARELGELRAQVATSAAAARLTSFRESLTHAIAGKRVTPAALRMDIVPMLDDANREKAEAAMSALPEAAAGINEQLGAVCAAVSLSEGEGKRVAAYLAMRPAAVVPQPKAESADARGEPLDDKTDRVAKAFDKVRAQMTANQARPSAATK